MPASVSLQQLFFNDREIGIQAIDSKQSRSHEAWAKNSGVRPSRIPISSFY